ncbi:MAG: MerR family transcriptional regulator [Chloroflexaceae bacterium]|jgi:MerR family transcriptional regulator/heat shock protein HspR|nr:MerR family transcriptional regulator [Chloroflexaceae bacterium]
MVRYTIRVAAARAGLHEQSLRMYERRGLLHPQRSKGNIRLYSEEDIEQVLFIKRLMDDLGVNLAGVEVILHMRHQLLEAQMELARLRGEEELR